MEEEVYQPSSCEGIILERIIRLEKLVKEIIDSNQENESD